MVTHNSIDLYGVSVFNDTCMKERLPKETYETLAEIIRHGGELTMDIADVVALHMKNWAMDKGATHFSHWFQPMTGSTAEKHDSFIAGSSGGRALTEFSGKSLIKGESDASSFPSGGLRATFEARGYTAWDCTSHAFIKQDGNGVTVLCIPTAFCSYTGEALDNKTPLLRSMEALNTQALRVLGALGESDVTSVMPTVGAEQEYFLVDAGHYWQRKDLIYADRTLFGAKPPKGQELGDSYYAAISEKVSAFMNEVNEELWKLGVLAKTQHNEVAPGQYELAPVFTNANIANDQNQLIMEQLRKIATRHKLACILHEKPFAGLNGSGKHNNWGLSTDTGLNLFKAGKQPEHNLPFLAFFTAVIAAVDIYAPLFRTCCASASNEQRLGGNEAPPDIISVFIGDDLSELFERVCRGDDDYEPEDPFFTIGVSTLPALKKDNTDRNRTSPLAFTGNKFELRVVGSSQSIALPNIVFNTAVSDILKCVADRIESAPDKREAAMEIVRELYNKHKRIIFNGNSYSEEWREEAKKRGLPIVENTVEAISMLGSRDSIELFERHSVLSEAEILSRVDISLRAYAKQVNIEALTMTKMARVQVLPASIDYANKLASGINEIRQALTGVSTSAQEQVLREVSEQIQSLHYALERLEKALEMTPGSDGTNELAQYYHSIILPAMHKLRTHADMLETMVERSMWPFPTYGELLFDN